MVSPVLDMFHTTNTVTHVQLWLYTDDTAYCRLKVSVCTVTVDEDYDFEVHHNTQQQSCNSAVTHSSGQTDLKTYRHKLVYHVGCRVYQAMHICCVCQLHDTRGVT